MPVATTVNSCTVADCVYNSGNTCHALAITVEEPSPATCGTYKARSGGESGGLETQVANVGACKASSCAHNSNLMCTAPQVRIALSDGEISCLTYKKD